MLLKYIYRSLQFWMEMKAPVGSCSTIPPPLGPQIHSLYWRSQVWACPNSVSPIPCPPCDLPGFCVEVWQGVTTGTRSYIYSLGSHPSLLQSSQKGNQPIQHGICQSCAAREVKNERQRRQKLSKWVFLSLGKEGFPPFVDSPSKY